MTELHSMAAYLRPMGFEFDPFEHLEASADPRIGDYLVGLDSIAVAWAPSPALIFAPAGGGKTAMRVYTIRSSWLGLAGPHPFPVSCVLPATESRPPDEEVLYRFLARTVAADLLIGIAHRPRRLLSLDSSDISMLVGLWQTLMPRRYRRALARLEDTRDPSQIVAGLDPAYRIKGFPPPDQVAELCANLRKHDRTPVANKDARALWGDLIDIVQGRLGFSAIYLLFDGLDASPSTYHSPEVGLAWFRAFWQCAPEWANAHVFVKGFLPEDYRHRWSAADPSALDGYPVAELSWTPALLAEMLRLRVAIATANRAGSMDAFSSPGLRDVETLLASSLGVNAPREALVLMGIVLRAWQARIDGAADPSTAEVRLDTIDVEEALHQYVADRNRHQIASG